MDTRDSDLGDDSMVSKKSIKLRRKKFHLQKKKISLQKFCDRLLFFHNNWSEIKQNPFQIILPVDCRKSNRIHVSSPTKWDMRDLLLVEVVDGTRSCKNARETKKKLIYKYLLAQQTINRTWKLHLTTL